MTKINKAVIENFKANHVRSEDVHYYSEPSFTACTRGKTGREYWVQIGSNMRKIVEVKCQRIFHFIVSAFQFKLEWKNQEFFFQALKKDIKVLQAEVGKTKLNNRKKIEQNLNLREVIALSIPDLFFVRSLLLNSGSNTKELQNLKIEIEQLFIDNGSHMNTEFEKLEALIKEDSNSEEIEPAPVTPDITRSNLQNLMDGLQKKVEDTGDSGLQLVLDQTNTFIDYVDPSREYARLVKLSSQEINAEIELEVIQLAKFVKAFYLNSPQAQFWSEKIDELLKSGWVNLPRHSLQTQLNTFFQLIYTISKEQNLPFQPEILNKIEYVNHLFEHTDFVTEGEGIGSLAEVRAIVDIEELSERFEDHVKNIATFLLPDVHETLFERAHARFTGYETDRQYLFFLRYQPVSMDKGEVIVENLIRIANQVYKNNLPEKMHVSFDMMHECVRRKNLSSPFYIGPNKETSQKVREKIFRDALMADEGLKNLLKIVEDYKVARGENSSLYTIIQKQLVTAVVESLQFVDPDTKLPYMDLYLSKNPNDSQFLSDVVSKLQLRETTHFLHVKDIILTLRRITSDAFKASKLKETPYEIKQHFVDLKKLGKKLSNIPLKSSLDHCMTRHKIQQASKRQELLQIIYEYFVKVLNVDGGKLAMTHPAYIEKARELDLNTLDDRQILTAVKELHDVIFELLENKRQSISEDVYEQLAILYLACRRFRYLD